MYEEILFLTRIYYFRMQIQVHIGSHTLGLDCCAGIVGIFSSCSA